MYLLLFLFSSARSSAENAPAGAWLLASKTPLSPFGFQGKDYVFQYGLYNVGDRPATKITLDDNNSFPAEYFSIVAGMTQITVSRLNPGGNITHVVILHATQAGEYDFPAARITYSPDVDSAEMRERLTTTPGKVYFFLASEYERRHGSKLHYFLVFFVALGTTTLGSLVLYLQSRRRRIEIEEPAKKAY